MTSSRLFSYLVLLSIGMVAVSPAEPLRAVTSRGTSAVAVGDNGRVLYAVSAPHNVAWFSADVYLFQSYRAVTTTANDYVAVGEGGRIMRSFDPEGQGRQWIPEASRTTLDLYGVTHSGNRLVAVGDSGMVLYKESQSEGRWTQIEPQNRPTQKRLRSVAGNMTGSITAAVGDSGTILWSSYGLTTWYPVDSVPTDAELRGVALGPGAVPGRFWAVGTGGTILRSIPSATEWALLSSPVSTDLNAIAFSPLLQQGTIGVAVGENGTILWSNGGETWNEVDSGVTVHLNGVAYTGTGIGGGFVVVGDSEVILWSPDGVSWTGVLVPTERVSWGSIRSRWTPSRQSR